MGKLRLAGCGVACLSIISTGCVQKEFQEQKAQSIMASNPIHLDAEQVTLTSTQLECGVQSDLWDPPSSSSPDHTTARLTQAGRDLHFDDDVVIAEPGARLPYVQVRGDFMMSLADGTSIHDDGADARLVEGRLSVIIPNSCFPDPLPVMGVRKGRFTPDVNPVMHFKLLDDGWHFDRLIH